MIGAISGDIIGSVYEFKNCLRQDFQPLFHPDARFTDDTVCTVAIADSLLQQVDPAVSLQTWCRRYAENGGWGQRFALWIYEDPPQPYNSWGNGAAMRISSVGMLASNEDEVVRWANEASRVTHNHPEAIDCAEAVALAVYWGRKGLPALEVRNSLELRFGFDLSRTPDEIRTDYKRSERAIHSVPQAITCALTASSFEESVRIAVSIGGDSDTISAIAGGIAEARFGVPEAIASRTLRLLPEDMRDVVTRFYRRIT